MKRASNPDLNNSIYRKQCPGPHPDPNLPPRKLQPGFDEFPVTQILTLSHTAKKGLQKRNKRSEVTSAEKGSLIYSSVCL